MFDIGFWELLLVFVLALLILGPERLPRVAMAAGRWLGRARAMARNLRIQLEQEIDAPKPQRNPAADTTSTERETSEPDER